VTKEEKKGRLTTDSSHPSSIRSRLFDLFLDDEVSGKGKGGRTAETSNLPNFYPAAPHLDRWGGEKGKMCSSTSTRRERE